MRRIVLAVVVLGLGFHSVAFAERGFVTRPNQRSFPCFRPSRRY